MRLLRRAAGVPERVAVFSGSFNPPTVAHLALAQAALRVADEVLFVLPKVFPHAKTYDGAGMEDRLRMVEAVTAREEAFSVGVSDGGLFADIAAECRQVYPPRVRMSFLCGRDAAERIVNWDYGRPGAIAEMLEEFDLLVADGRGVYEPPAGLSGKVRALATPAGLELVSATEVRSRIRDGRPWRHLAPPEIHAEVEKLYGPRGGPGPAPPAVAPAGT